MSKFSSQIFERRKRVLGNCARTNWYGFLYNSEKPLEEGDDEYTVEYAADLAIDHYLPITTTEQRTEGSLGEGSSQSRSPATEFSLRKIYSMEDSLFQLVQNKTESISGIVIPWAYVANKYSTFAWHTEDLFLYSFNYMHEGGCKIWYTVPLEDVQKFRALLLRLYDSDIKKRPSLLDEVTIFFSPINLIKEGVDFMLIPDQSIQNIPGTRGSGSYFSRSLSWRV